MDKRIACKINHRFHHEHGEEVALVPLCQFLISGVGVSLIINDTLVVLLLISGRQGSCVWLTGARIWVNWQVGDITVAGHTTTGREHWLVQYHSSVVLSYIYLFIYLFS